MSEPSVDNLNVALKALRTLRHGFINYLNALTDGQKNDSVEDTDLATQKSFIQWKNNLRELERNIQVLSPPVTLNPAGPKSVLSNIDVLSLDPTTNKLPFYHQLLDCYTWTDKVCSYSNKVHSICNGNHIKRSSMPYKRKPPLLSIYNATAPPQTVDMHIQSIKSMFQDMTFFASRPLGTHAVLQVTLGRVLKAVITFRGLLIENIVIRSYNESHLDEENKVDLYRPSQYKVFQKVSDNANAAVLHFFPSGCDSDVAWKEFFCWLNSYSSLFSDSCKKCNYHIRFSYPPTWRAFRTLQPFHEQCRP